MAGWAVSILAVGCRECMVYCEEAVFACSGSVFVFLGILRPNKNICVFPVSSSEKIG